MRSPGKVWPDEEALVRLVREAQRGRLGALDALLATLRPAFVAYFRPTIGPDEAEDAAQLALLSIMRALSGIDADRAVSYVVAVAHRRLGKARRRLARAKRQYGPLKLALGLESPLRADHDADYHELARALRASFATLPPDRQALLLEPLRGVNASALPTREHVNPATLRTWRKRARARLRAALASLR
jgi:RNA polymerase sigma factor (sigma-70 family)